MRREVLMKVLIAGVMACFFAGSAFSSTLSFKSTSLLRLYQEKVYGLEDEEDFFIPYYQYLDLHFRDVEKGISIKVNGWGMLQLNDYYIDEEGKAQLTDGDLNYAYVSIECLKKRAFLSLGRQFIYAGVLSSEQIDGGQFRLSFWKVGLTGYFGVPVEYEYDNRSKDFVTGGRLFYADSKVEVGFSGVYSTDDGEENREWIGGDLWVRPIRWLEVNGRLYYSLLSEEIYDASFLPVLKPTSSLQIVLKYSRTVPSEYIDKTSIFSVFSTDAVQEFGTKIGYDLTKNLALWADFSFFKYDSGNNAFQYGINPRFKYGKGSRNLLSVVLRRHESRDSRLEFFNEIALFLKHYLTSSIECGLNSVNYHRHSTGEGKNFSNHNIFAGYSITPNLELVGNFEVATDYEDEIEYRGIVKLNYEFDGYIVR